MGCGCVFITRFHLSLCWQHVDCGNTGAVCRQVLLSWAVWGHCMWGWGPYQVRGVIIVIIGSWWPGLLTGISKVSKQERMSSVGDGVPAPAHRLLTPDGEGMGRPTSAPSWPCRCCPWTHKQLLESQQDSLLGTQKHLRAPGIVRCSFQMCQATSTSVCTVLYTSC